MKLDVPHPAQLSAETVTQEVIEKYQRYVNPTQVALLKIGGFDHIEHTARGTRITDLEGNSYIDCLGGYGVFSLGHCHPKVVAAVQEQAGKLPLATKTFLNKPLADLCERLAQITPGNLQYSFLCNSGTEAVEAALKIARMATGKTEVISTMGGFHGKTMGALTATGREVYRSPFKPLIPGFTSVVWNDLDAVRAAVTDETAAIIVEPVQGEGGIKVPSLDYLPGLRKLCDDRGILLIVDEVQTGLGRTGRLFGVEHWDVMPDLMTLAKALGGGVMPVGAVIGTETIWDKVFRENPFIHTSTFGGNELACVAALTAIDVTLSEDLSGRAREKGEYFLEKLRSVQQQFDGLVVDVRGLGLMIGVEFSDPDIAKLVIGTLMHQGVVAAYTLNNPNVIRLEPPLIITYEEIDFVIEGLKLGLAEAGDLLAMLDEE